MDNSSVKISILVPVYNVEAYLQECIESIISQIDNNAELILMNDDSTDNSNQVLSTYYSHPQIKVVQAPYNRGLSGTRNALLEFASNDFIWFIDSDDVMHAGAYQVVMKHLQTMPVDVLCGDYISWTDDKKIRKKSFIGRSGKVFRNKNNSFLQNVIKNNSNHVWNKVYRRNIFEKVQFKVGLKFEDIYFMTDLSEICQSYCYCRYPLIDYRERTGSIVKTMDEKYIDDYLSAFIYRVDIWKKYSFSGSEKFLYYLLYKVFNRYLGLIKQLSNENNKELLIYTHQQYTPIFLSYKEEIANNIGWIRGWKLEKRYQKLQQFLCDL